MEDRLRQMEARLESAERQVRSLRRACTGLLVVGLGLALVRPAVTQGIKVSKMTAPFQVVDSAGRLIMMVETARPGPRLQLFDSAGRPAVELGMAEKGGGKLDVFDRTGKPLFSKPDPAKP